MPLTLKDASGQDVEVLTSDEIAEMVTGATKRQLDAATKKFSAEFTKSLEERDQSFIEKINLGLDEKLTKLLENDGDESNKDGKSKGKAGADDGVKKQLEALAAKLEESEKARQTAESKALEIESQRKFDGARERLRELLKDKAQPDLLGKWVNDLTIVEKRLGFSEDGTPTLRVKHTPYKGATETEEDLPLDQAVAALIQHPEQKLWQPVPQAAGDKQTRGPSGQRGPSKPNIKSDNPVERAEARLNQLGTSLEAALGGSD